MTPETLVQHAHGRSAPARPTFESESGLRSLLIDLHRQPERWHGQEAQALLAYCADRYRALANKYGQSGGDAAAAAFEVLRAPATRWARDPWGVVTQAVRRTLQAEQRAHALLCGVEQARHLMHAPVHDATRFADRELLELNPVLWTAPEQDDVHDVQPAAPVFEGFRPTASVPPRTALSLAVRIFVDCGWPADAAQAALEHICSRLTQAGQRRRAYEYLRHDREAPAHLDLEPSQWTRVLTVVLGAPAPDLERTDVGRGLLWRLVAGQHRSEVAADPRVTTPLAQSAPQFPGGGSCVR